MFMRSDTVSALADRARSLRERMDADERIRLAATMSQTLEAAANSGNAHAIAVEVIQILVEDEVEDVRKAISEAVAGSPHLPGSVARQLAEDINDIAIPVLLLSPTLTDRVLEEIVEAGVPGKIEAIAGRHSVPEMVSDAIVQSGKLRAIVRLLRNPGAEIADATMANVIQSHGERIEIQDAVLSRGELPQAVIKLIRDMAEAHVKSFVQRYFNLHPDMLDVEKGRKLMDRKGDDRRSDWWDNKKGAV